MDSTVIAAIIGFAGGIVVTILKAVLSGSRFTNWMKGRESNLIGKWQSIWGPLPNKEVKYKELLEITKQSSQRIEGFITKEDEPQKKWTVEGKYGDNFLMLIYSPAKDAKDNNFLDYGCYFFQRRADGSFEGYSTGFGPNDGQPGEGVTTDYHTLKRA